MEPLLKIRSNPMRFFTNLQLKLYFQNSLESRKKEVLQFFLLPFEEQLIDHRATSGFEPRQV